MSKATDMLMEALGNMRVTFDSGRNFTHPCTFCGKQNQPHELVTIGRYSNGDELTRPVCSDCMPIAKAHSDAARRPSSAVSSHPAAPVASGGVEVRVRAGADGGPFVYLPRSQFNAGDTVRVIVSIRLADPTEGG